MLKHIVDFYFFNTDGNSTKDRILSRLHKYKLRPIYVFGRIMSIVAQLFYANVTIVKVGRERMGLEDSLYWIMQLGLAFPLFLWEAFTKTENKSNTWRCGCDGSSREKKTCLSRQSGKKWEPCK